MISGIEKELIVFWQAILSGNFIYLAYSVLRVFRRIVRHHLIWISVEDLLYWIGMAFFLFTRIHKASRGVIRWYFVVGVLLGGLLTHCLLRKSARKYIDKSEKKE